MLKKIAIKLLLLLLIFVVLNFIYSATLFNDDMKKINGEIIEMQQEQDSTDIFYFGESSNVTYAETDSIKNSISEITNFFFPTLKIQAVTKYATHAGVYKEWLKQIDLNKKFQKAIVVTMNLRSFDATWIHSKLETSLQESLVLTKPYPYLLNRFLLSLQAFDNKTEQQREQDMLENWRITKLKFPFPYKYQTVREWDNSMAQGGHLKLDGSWDSDKIILACHYIKGYAFNLDENNPRIKDFDEISDWCEKQHIPLYLNLMAENVQYADSLVGKELVFLMRENRNYLVKRYNKNNCKVIDNLELVNGKNFIDQTWTTEHYDYLGRMLVARNLADTLKSQFKNSYKKAY